MYAYASFLLLLFLQWTNLAAAAPPNEKVTFNLPAKPSPPLPTDKDSTPHSEHAPIRSDPYAWLVVPQTMDMIHNQGGVLPEGKKETSMYQHMLGNKNSVYVTAYHTIRDARMAYASIAGTKAAGTLLCIHKAENAIELTGSIPQTENFNLQGLVMLGGVWDAQIKKFAKLRSGDTRKDEKINFVDNNNYDVQYQHHHSSNARPRLAGLPLDHPALGTQSRFSSELECDKEAHAYMDTIAEAVGWRKEWPLVLAPADATIATDVIDDARRVIDDFARKEAVEAERAGDLAAMQRSLTKARNGLSFIKVYTAKIGHIIRYSGSLPHSTFNQPWRTYFHYSNVVAALQAKAFLIEATQLNRKVQTHCRNTAASVPLDDKLIKELKEATNAMEDIAKRLRITLKANENRQSEIRIAKNRGEKSAEFEAIKPEIWLGIRQERKLEAMERDLHLLDELIILQTPYYKDLLEMIDSAKNSLLGLEAKNQERAKMEQKTKQITESKEKEADQEIDQVLEDISEEEKKKTAAIEEARKIQNNPNRNKWEEEALSTVADWIYDNWHNADTAVAVAGTGIAAAAVGGKVAIAGGLGSKAANNIQTVDNAASGTTAKANAEDTSQVAANSQKVDTGKVERVLNRQASSGLVNQAFEEATEEAKRVCSVLIEQLEKLPVASGNLGSQTVGESLAQPASGEAAGVLQGVKYQSTRVKTEVLAEKRRRSIGRRDNGHLDNQELQKLVDQISASVATRAVIKAMLTGMQHALELMAPTVKTTI
ncbi:hypothetical protein DCS_02480 [Drechmeria coniospora]|uniref:Enterotoxin n=1 Tax=Drechmeria coniospora TaxID=98403 RepID=A0A151GW57_DRECN|nr:hypothetical protein DCS_02480 [Drechmeria coniospora]KYK61338.1 hypothetical protein DCS_02480 [Drechmeria coniospora]